MARGRSPEMEELFEGILSLQTVEECERFFTDICTIKELQALTQRLQVAKQLYEGRNYNEVTLTYTVTREVEHNLCSKRGVETKVNYGHLCVFFYKSTIKPKGNR